MTTQKPMNLDPIKERAAGPSCGGSYHEARARMDRDALLAEVERLRLERQHLRDENATMRAILVEVASDYTRRVGKQARDLLGEE